VRRRRGGARCGEMAPAHGSSPPIQPWRRRDRERRLRRLTCSAGDSISGRSLLDLQRRGVDLQWHGGEAAALADSAMSFACLRSPLQARSVGGAGSRRRCQMRQAAGRGNAFRESERHRQKKRGSRLATWWVAARPYRRSVSNARHARCWCHVVVVVIERGSAPCDRRSPRRGAARSAGRSRARSAGRSRG